MNKLLIKLIGSVWAARSQVRSGKVTFFFVDWWLILPSWSSGSSHGSIA